MKQVLIINGSASSDSSNQKLIHIFMEYTKSFFRFTLFKDLKCLPHFDPELSANQPPAAVRNFREKVENADGVLICTPEYIFSIPGQLKNALEWCVSTPVFSGKPLGLITASASGQKGHEELQLIMNTLMANFRPETTLLIQGIKAKFDGQGELADAKVKSELLTFIEAFQRLL